MEQPSSNLFEGYKSVGHVTGPLPFIVRHGKSPQDTRIVTIVGKTFHTYTTNLNLVEASIPHEHDIRMIVSDTRYIYCASGRSILSWGRGSRTLILRFDNGHKADIKLLSKFGADRLVSVDEENRLINWNIVDKSILNSIDFEDATLRISALCHPFNYKDKLLIGSEQGPIELWNISSGQCLYKLRGWDSAVQCIVQSPVEDVVGIGLADGHVYVQNIKYDEIVMKIYQEYGVVTSMSFRLDGQPYLVTASEVGHLMIWNLERKRLASQIRNAHSDRISKCQFVRNEQLLVTSGSDNSIKIWSMDMSDGSGSMLCQRAGHSEPPSFIRFYGPKGFNLLSAGNDSTMKMFHLYSEKFNRNLGTARLNHKKKSKNSSLTNKLPPIVCFAAETAKEKRWDNIVACHRDSSLVTTWNYDKCKMGEHIIFQPSFDKNQVSASCVAITGCGNFVVIGFSNGFIFKYNLQSGIFRSTYECPKLSQRVAHDGRVNGLTVDAIDMHLISGGQDSMLRIWNFKTSALIAEFHCPANILQLNLHRENNLVAVALENNEIEIRDLETRTLVRKFIGKSRILDMTFSHDSLWLIVSYDDSSVRTWDLQSGKLIDAFRLSSPCTSLSISNTGEFLATAHANSVGINIWSNYSFYQPTALRAIEYEAAPPLLDMPYVRCDESNQDDEEDDDQELPAAVDDLVAPVHVSPKQLHENLITLSGLPSSRWKNLLSVDEVREKQLIQEEERRAKPVKVPFFIPVKDGLKPKLDQEALSVAGEGDQSKIMSKIQELSLLSPSAQCLIKCGQQNNYKEFFKQLKELGPSATDAEIRSFGSDTCGDNQVMLYFLEAVDQTLKKHIDYDLALAWLALFLAAHSDLIQADVEVKRRCAAIATSNDWDCLNENSHKSICVMNFIRSSIL